VRKSNSQKRNKPYLLPKVDARIKGRITREKYKDSLRDDPTEIHCCGGKKKFKTNNSLVIRSSYASASCLERCKASVPRAFPRSYLY
jgi:hypothetical protein